MILLVITEGMSCSNKKTGNKRFISSDSTIMDSCFSTPSLKKIAITYNKLYPDSSSRIPESLLIKPNRVELIKAVRNAFVDKCSTSLLPHHSDSCVIQVLDKSKSTDTVFTDEERGVFPPIASDNQILKSKPWNTTEINRAMKYIESKHPHFMFIETTPIDFDIKDDFGRCVVSELCKFDIRNIILKNKTAFGIVFNTHPHTMPGDHWVCVFCCLKTARICYYDSYGFMPEKEIAILMKKTAEQYSERYKKDMAMVYNDHQNQTGGVDCGTYCIGFLDQMAEHGNLIKSVTFLGNDKTIQKLRKQYMTENIYA